MVLLCHLPVLHHLFRQGEKRCGVLQRIAFRGRRTATDRRVS